MAKLANLLTMVELLNTGKKYSIKELAEQLEVSDRTIREYKLFLEEAGIYVDTIRGPYGGYVLTKEVNFPKVRFVEQDMKIINDVARFIKDEKIKQKLDNLTNKIEQNILHDENEYTKLLNDDKKQNVYNIISKALKYNFKVKIKYYNLQHGESIRTIYPLGLYLFEQEWWCSSYWEEKDDMRQFHLKRILEAELLEEKFDPKEINIKF